MAGDNTPAGLLSWLSSAEASAILLRHTESPQSGEAQQFRVELCQQYIPKLKKGAASLRELGMDDAKFAAKLDECVALCNKLGGPVAAASGSPYEQCTPRERLESVLSSQPPSNVRECKVLFEQLGPMIEQAPLNDLNTAERFLRLLRHLQLKLFEGSRLSIEGGVPDEYEALATHCRGQADKLDAEITLHKGGISEGSSAAPEFQWEWKPYKLIDSVLDRHTNLIRCVDKLRDSFGAEFQELHLRFPEIVVVGTESVGKSSVMEKLAGVPIFPRGEGTTTRISFRLRLHHLTEAEMEQRKRGLPDGQRPVLVRNTEVLMRFEGAAAYLPDTATVHRTVQESNQRVAAKGLSIDTGEVVLNMYSTVFPDLTLLDMPGLIRAKGPSDPADIVQRCEDLVRDKIGHEDAIVLAVLNARANLRGSAEGIRMVQQVGAEARTLAVLTCVDRTDAEDEIPSVMRQTKGLEFPTLGYHYHAVIGRDVKRTASGVRAASADCDSFVKGVREGDLAAVTELLDGNRVSEECLTSVMDSAEVKEAERRGTQELARKVREKLEETRREQDRFEDRYFQAPSEGGVLSEWQRERRVDPKLLAPDLGEYLGSAKLGKRLSEMLENHIRVTWAPKMLAAVNSKLAECQSTKDRLGLAPPPVPDPSLVSNLVERLVQLLSARRAELEEAMGAAVRACPPCPKQPVLSQLNQHNGWPTSWTAFATPPHDAKSYKEAVRGAEAAIVKAQGAVAKVVGSCLDDRQPELCLYRFPVFRGWVELVVGKLLEGKAREAVQRLRGFRELLEEEVVVVAGQEREHYARLALQVGEVLPRVLSKHLVRQVLAELPALLRRVPADGRVEGRSLVEEEAGVAGQRQRVEAQLVALRKVREELRAYEQEVPGSFVCPISQDLMHDPVVAPDGRSYERSCIERYIREGNTRSPLGCGEWGPAPQLFPNRALKDQIDEWKTTPVKKQPGRASGGSKRG